MMPRFGGSPHCGGPGTLASVWLDPELPAREHGQRFAALQRRLASSWPLHCPQPRARRSLRAWRLHPWLLREGPGDPWLHGHLGILNGTDLQHQGQRKVPVPKLLQCEAVNQFVGDRALRLVKWQANQKFRSVTETKLYVALERLPMPINFGQRVSQSVVGFCWQRLHKPFDGFNGAILLKIAR